MQKFLSIAAFFVTIPLAFAQFAPPAGQPGTTAMYKDSSAFIAWATGCKIKRGYQDIADPSSGYATFGDSAAAIGKADGLKIVSLGDGGSAILTFKQPIANGQGNDFAVFENGFNDTFLELGFVEVSSDGVNYFSFAATSNTQDSVQMGNDAEMDARKINNLAGKYRANYGTPFDLQELAGTPGLDVNAITHVKITDVVGSIQANYATYDKNGKKIHDPWPTPFASGGFDLDAVGVIHEAPNSVEEDASAIQFQVFPNPVNARSKIQVILNSNEPVTIDVIDLTGHEVAVIAIKASAQHTYDMQGLAIKNGVYVLRIRAGAVMKIEKIIVLNE